LTEGALTALTELNLQHNKLKALPSEISNMISLRDLNLFGNQLEDAGLPESLFDIKSLTKLDLECNFITSLPLVATQKRNLTLLVDPTVNIGQEQQAKKGSNLSTYELITIKVICS
jgi:Leucine-rich repeat (LRR) protein